MPIATLSCWISLVAIGTANFGLAWSSYTISSSLLPLTPPAAFTVSMAICAPVRTDLPSAAANPVWGVLNPILMVSAEAADAVSARAAAAAMLNFQNVMILLPSASAGAFRPALHRTVPPALRRSILAVESKLYIQVKTNVDMV